MSEKMFPIMDGPSIPWRLLEPHRPQAILNHQQTLERLAERGGLSPCEAVAILEDRKWTRILYPIAHLQKHIDADIGRELQSLRAENERLKGEKEHEHWLKQLLAIIHRDGGHYLTEHGLKKATEDAITKSHTMLSQIEKSSLAVQNFEILAAIVIANYGDWIPSKELYALVSTLNETGKGAK